VQLVSKISNLCDHNPPTLQTDGRTDGRHAIPRPRICTKVHCTVKIKGECNLIADVMSSGQCYRLAGAGAHQHCARTSLQNECKGRHRWCWSHLSFPCPPSSRPARILVLQMNVGGWMLTWYFLQMAGRMTLQLYCVLLNDRGQEF